MVKTWENDQAAYICRYFFVSQFFHYFGIFADTRLTDDNIIFLICIPNCIIFRVTLWEFLQMITTRLLVVSAVALKYDFHFDALSFKGLKVYGNNFISIYLRFLSYRSIYTGWESCKFLIILDNPVHVRIASVL